jgi:hypothetical protein
MHPIAAMDPTNPRWETSAERTRRSATIWKVIAGAAAASVLTAVVVASCLDRDEARRDMDEPAYVETTSATTTATGTPATTRDSTGGIAPNGAVSGRADEIAGTTSSTTTITSAPISTQVPRRERTYTPVPLPFERANGDSSTSGTLGTGNGPKDAEPIAGVHESNFTPLIRANDPNSIGIDAGPNAGHASHANNDPNNR